MAHSRAYATITARVLTGLADFMASRGLDFAAEADSASIDPSLANQPDSFISFDSVCGLLTNAAASCGDEAFGLHFAAYCPLCPIGMIHYLVSNAPDLRTALQTRARYMRLIVTAYDMEFVERNGQADYIWNCRGDAAARQHFADYAAMLVVERVRLMLSQSDWMPVRVSLRRPAPRTIEPYRRGLGDNIRFDAERTAITLDTQSLNRKLPAAEPALFAELKRVAEEMSVGTGAEPTLATRSRRALVMAFPHDGAVSSREIASGLGVSVRSLQRSLAAAGTTFVQLRHETRRQAALGYLNGTDLPLTEIAFLLGFSELSAFSRAAKSWFGTSPRTIRQTARAAQAGKSTSTRSS